MKLTDEQERHEPAGWAERRSASRREPSDGGAAEDASPDGEPRLRTENAALRSTVQALEQERARLLEELQQARSAVRESDARDQLLSMVSHELRTPLQSLTMGIGLLMSRFRAAADEVPREWTLSRLEKTHRNAARLAQLVETLLDASRIREGRLKLQLEEVDLSALVEQVITRARDELAWARCTCTLSSPGPVVGQWDRLRLDLVCSNLLSNALKYGAGRPIRVRVEADEAWAKLTVEDEGVGIAPEHQARIFERFERAPTGSLASGLGLGLWMTKHLVEAMHGTVGVVSRPAEGSAFTVVLPRASR